VWLYGAQGVLPLRLIFVHRNSPHQKAEAIVPNAVILRLIAFMFFLLIFYNRPENRIQDI
jgi:hypothetical protein